MTRYFRDAAGAYLGAYDGPDDEPFGAGAIEVAAPPADARATWNGAGWDEPAPVRDPLPRLVVADRLTDAEVAMVAGLQSGDAQAQRFWLRWVSAIEVSPDNPETRAGFEAVFGVSRAAELLAPEGA